MDRQDHLEWLLTMAKAPGWKAQSWHRAKELDELFPGMSDELKQLMTGPVANSESEDLTQQKPPLAGQK